MKDKYGNEIDESKDTNADKETNKNGGVVLNADQLAEITASVSAAIADMNNTKATTEEDVTKGGDNDKSSSKDESLDMDTILSKVVKLVKDGNITEQNKVFATMWNDKFANTMSQTPGLEDYLNEEDDYAQIRLEKLNNIESYDDKVKALDQLKKSFKQALAGTAGRKPINNTKLNKRVEENQERYDNVGKKWMNGEYTSESDFADDFFGAMGNEMKAAQQ